MRARDVMSSPVITVTAHATVTNAARLLSDNGITTLPVVDGDDELVAVVSEADLLQTRFPTHTRNLNSPGDGFMRAAHRAHTVGEVMTTDVISATPRTDLADIAERMLTTHIHAVPIVEGRQVVGIVGRRDLIRTIARGDSTISGDVRRRLEAYGGQGRWTVAVSGGVVAISDAFDDPTDRHVALLIAQSVPGVARAEVMAIRAETTHSQTLNAAMRQP